MPPPRPSLPPVIMIISIAGMITAVTTMATTPRTSMIRAKAAVAAAIMITATTMATITIMVTATHTDMAAAVATIMVTITEHAASIALAIGIATRWPDDRHIPKYDLEHDPAMTTILDLTGLKCPMPVLRTRKALQTLRGGERLEVHCTDPMAVIDIPTLINETGDRIERRERSDERIVFVIEKRAESR